MSAPFGFTVPFSVAELVVMELAEPAVTVGTGAADVEKLRMFPLPDPALFPADTL